MHDGSIFQRSFTSAHLTEDDSSTKIIADSLIGWFTLGWGASTVTDGEFATAVGMSPYLGYGHNTFCFRIMYDQGTAANKIPHEEVFDFGLFYGYNLRSSNAVASFVFGPAYGYVKQRIFDKQDTVNSFPVDHYSAKTTRIFGLGWQVQGFLRFSDSSGVGLGLTFGGNVNSTRSFNLFLLSIVFGHF